VDSWFGLVVPAATPKEIVHRLNAELVRIGNLPEVRERLGAQGASVTTSTPETFTQTIHDDYARWGKVVETSGVRSD
jgi:tripartite-type tricarboxylate transporter receptor subunit TctC